MFGKGVSYVKPIVFGESVQGASHKRADTECQDSCRKLFLGDTLIMAVADGHGSSACPYSKTGSQTAVNVFCDIMADYYSNYKKNTSTLLTYLNREGETKVARYITDEWKRRILKTHTDNKREKIVKSDGKKDVWAICKQYGSTLVGMMITPVFTFSFQLGDGDIVYVDEESARPVITPEKVLGIETHSLSKEDAWSKAVTSISHRGVEADKPCAFMLTTDGFANSFTNQEEYYTACKEYFNMTREHGVKAVTGNIKKWLAETSELGCGDDVTMLCAYFPIRSEVTSDE